MTPDTNNGSNPELNADAMIAAATDDLYKAINKVIGDGTKLTDDSTTARIVKDLSDRLKTRAQELSSEQWNDQSHQTSPEANVTEPTLNAGHGVDQVSGLNSTPKFPNR